MQADNYIVHAYYFSQVLNVALLEINSLANAQSPHMPITVGQSAGQPAGRKMAVSLGPAVREMQPSTQVV